MKRKTPRPALSKVTPRGNDAIEIVRRYISRINAGDPVGLARLAGERIRFVDATGAHHSLGREAWEAYFSDFPDYRIQVDEIFSYGSSVAVFGSASGSFKGRGASVPGAAWQFPAAWRAKLRAGKLVEWQVYGDIEPMLRSASVGR